MAESGKVMTENYWMPRAIEPEALSGQPGGLLATRDLCEAVQLADAGHHQAHLRLSIPALNQMGQSETYFHLSRAPVFSSAHLKLHRIHVETKQSLQVRERRRPLRPSASMRPCLSA